MAEDSLKAYRDLNRAAEAPYSRDRHAMVEGDAIGVFCRAPGQFRLVRGTGAHKGHVAVLRKNASAIVLSPYTNVPGRD